MYRHPSSISLEPKYNKLTTADIISRGKFVIKSKVSFNPSLSKSHCLPNKVWFAPSKSLLSISIEDADMQSFPDQGLLPSSLTFLDLMFKSYEAGLQGSFPSVLSKTTVSCRLP